nr:MAG TPA: replisome organizer [Caudoviricetes sp.]
MGRLKDDNNIQIYGWMTTKLKLKGNELLIYAVIYSFSRNDNGNGVFNASTAYLCEWTNSSRQSIIDCLNSLLNKKFIIKIEDNSRKKKPNVYKINENIFDKTCKENLQEHVKKVDKTCKESLHNNNIINTKYNTNNNIAAAKEKFQRFLDDDFKEIVDLFSNNIHPINGEVEGNKLADYLDSYGKNWVLEAIKEAALCNGRSVNYIGKILMRWEKEGFKNDTSNEKKAATMVRQGKTVGRKRVYSTNKTETTEEARRKFANEKSGWD